MYKAHINGDKVQTCKVHCLNTAKYARESTGSISIQNVVYLCGLLHDAGKCTEEFNAYIELSSQGEKVAKGTVIHSFAGLEMVLARYHSYYNSNAEENVFGNLTAELIAIAIGSHHGLFDVYNSEYKSGFKHRFDKQPYYDRDAAKNYYRECFSTNEIDKIFKNAKQEVEELYCDKIIKLIQDTSDETKTEEMLFYLGVLERLILSALIDGDRRDTAEFMLKDTKNFLNIRTKSIDTLWCEALYSLEQKLDKLPQEKEIQRARRKLSDYCEKFSEYGCGIYRLNLPTGAGKTLSSLRYALSHAKKFNKKRIFFVIPLLSILDQNASVIKDAIGDESIVLEHHSNIIRENLSAEECERRDLLIDTWDSPIIITTLVQLLNTMFDGKTSSIRRFHSLVDSVVVIDEVQSVPTKMLSLFNLTLNFLSKVCNTTFLLCSATQPLFEHNLHKLQVDMRSVIPVKEMETYKSIFKRTNVLYMGELNADELIYELEKYYQKYKSVLLICNTKKEACELYNKSKCITDNCIHLSTAMCMAHRKDTIKEMEQKLDDEESFICVSTQLIEAGVNVSFGAVIRIAAGIDSVAQAAGRGNRNGESENLCPVGIVYLKGENLSKLKDIKLSQEVTGELIAEYKKRPADFENDLISDSSINYYYKTLYNKINKIMHYTDFCIDDDNILNYLSFNSKYVPENAERITMRQAFKTAGDKFKVFEDMQTSVLVPYRIGKEIINNILSDKFLVDIEWSRAILKEAKEYSVNLYDYQVKSLSEKGAIYMDNTKSIMILNPDYYDSRLGVIMEKGDVSEWNTLIL